MLSALLGVLGPVFRVITSLLNMISDNTLKVAGATKVGYESTREALKDAELSNKIRTSVKKLSPNQLRDRLRGVRDSNADKG